MANTVQYGLPQASPNAGGLNNQQLAQLLMQQQMLQGTSPDQIANYDPLGDQLNKAPHPVYSAVGGLADVAGQVGSAYFQKKQHDALLKQYAATQQSNNAAAANAISTAGQPDMSRSQADALDGGNMSLASQVFDRPATTPERVSAGLGQLSGPNAGLALALRPEILAAAQDANTPAAQDVILKPGEEVHSKDPVTGAVSPTASASAPLTPPDILRPGVLPAEIAKDKATKTIWSPAKPADYVANGLPPTSKGGQISSEGEFKPPVHQPGTIGPAFDANSGQPLGIIDYSDESVAPKIQSGEIITQPPKQLQTQDVQKLTQLGDVRRQLGEQAASYKPEYARILGADSKLRGFIGGQAYNEASEWFNKTQGALLNTVRDTVGRSPQLIEEFNKNRPEPTDAPDVVTRKMNNLIQMYDAQAQNIGKTYKRGGYLGQQVDQALGFDPSIPAPGSTTQNAARGNTFGGKAPAQMSNDELMAAIRARQQGGQ